MDNKSAPQDLLGDVITQFSNNTQLIREFVGIVKPALSTHAAEFIKTDGHLLLPMISELEKIAGIKLADEEKAKFGKERDKYFEIVKEEQDGVVFKIKDKGTLKKLQGAFKKLNSTIRIPNHLYETSLISLISNVELFLSQTLHIHFQAYPQAVTDKEEKQFSYSDLIQFNSVDDAKNYLIEKEIEKLLREGFVKWIEHLTKKLKLKIPYLIQHMDKLNEFFLRRNLLVHNGGKVNSIYFNNLSKTQQSSVKIGDNLGVTEDYLEEALTFSELSFILIAAELRSKGNISPDIDFKVINNIAFKHLENERFLIAEGLCKYLCENTKCSVANLWVAKINYWQAIKWQNRFDEVLENVRDADLTGMQEVFQLAKFALLDQYPSFVKLLPTVLDHKQLSDEEVESWPLFKKVRESKEYKEYSSKRAKAETAKKQAKIIKFDSTKPKAIYQAPKKPPLTPKKSKQPIKKKPTKLKAKPPFGKK